MVTVTITIIVMTMIIRFTDSLGGPVLVSISQYDSVITITSMVMTTTITTIRYDNSPTLNWWQPGSQCDSVVGAQDSATLPPGVDGQASCS